MNTQESIIALLQGDLADRSALDELLLSLVGSQEGQQMLLRQISMTRKLYALGAGISPTPAADARVLEEVALLEKSNDRLQAASWSWGGLKRRRFPAVSAVAGMLLALLAGFGIGRFTDTNAAGAKRAGEGRMEVQDAGPAPSIDSPTVSSKEPESGRALSDRSRSPIAFNSLSSIKSENRPEKAMTLGEKRIDRTLLEAESVRSQPVPQNSDGIRVVFPNGPEPLKSGNVVPITWDGIPDTVAVVVQFSSDSGKTWEAVGRNVAGGQLLWKVPSVPKVKKGLVKVSQENAGGVLPRFLQKLPQDTTLNISAFSPDGRLLAVPDYRGNITVWDARRWVPVRKLIGHAGTVVQAVFSSDGSMIASTSLDGTARIWDVVSGNEKHRMMGKGIVLQAAWTAAFNPNGDTVALGNDDGSVTLWDVVTGNELFTFQAHTEAIRSLSYSRNGDQLITASTDGEAGIFDAKSGLEIKRFSGHDGIANGIAMTGDGSLVITCGFDGTVKFWDAVTGRLKHAVQYFDGQRIASVVLSPDDRMLAIGGLGRDLLLVDPQSGEVLVTLPIKVNNRAIGAYPFFSPDSHTIAVTHENDILVWNLAVNSDSSDRHWTIE